jgi:hypothetical protein
MSAPAACAPAMADDTPFALQFSGRTKFRRADGFMAEITVAHLAEQLRLSGFVVMRKPSNQMHSAGPTKSAPDQIAMVGD